MEGEAGHSNKSLVTKVEIDTRGHKIIGIVHLPTMAYRGRLSDLLNRKEVTFLSISDAQVYSKENLEKPGYTADYIAVNINNIEIVKQLDEVG